MTRRRNDAPTRRAGIRPGTDSLHIPTGCDRGMAHPNGHHPLSARRVAALPATVSAWSAACYEPTKRTIDAAAAASLLVLLSPVFAVIAILITLEDGGPIFFWQTRVGRNGRPFRFFKFRSMVPNAEALKDKLEKHNEATGPIFKMKEDPRITRVGRVLRRYSLDELPQLVNVLRGDMSLVGPRPHLPREIERCPNYPMGRLSVPPGLVCLREVQGRSNLTFERWLETDMEYIQNRGLKTDFLILLRVVPAVFRAEGAY